jgi:hypothetical protein
MTQRNASHLLLCAALASCASDTEEDPWVCGGGKPHPGVAIDCFSFIALGPFYSAHDGVHAYSVTPWIPAADPDSQDSDPVLASSVVWHFDPSFVSASEFSELAGGVKLTTKRAGRTIIKLSATTLGGSKLRDSTTLDIAQADSQDWDLGNARYQNGERADLATTFPPARDGEGTCGLPFTLAFPRTAACVSCHDGRDNMSVEYSPTQTAHYSDSDLINIITTGAKPGGGILNNPFLTAKPMPDCVFAAFHTWALSEPELQGMLLKLRSIPPHAHE